MRTLLTSTLLALHALCSFLGHGGLHALQDAGGCQHHTSASTSVTLCVHHHGGQCHSHGDANHSHSNDDGQNQPAHHDPLDHDHEDCVICQWHVQGKISVSASAPLVADTPGLDELCVDVLVAADATPRTVRSRGPPA